VSKRTIARQDALDLGSEGFALIVESADDGARIAAEREQAAARAAVFDALQLDLVLVNQKPQDPMKLADYLAAHPKAHADTEATPGAVHLYPNGEPTPDLYHLEDYHVGSQNGAWLFLGRKTLIPAKGSMIHLAGHPGRVIRRQGAHHVRVKTERIRPHQDFLSHKVTVVRCSCEETWAIASLDENQPTP
jgi:hypothetical protein